MRNTQDFIKKYLGIFIAFLSIAYPTYAKERHFATLDWTVAETLIALGEEPKAVGDVESYKQWVAEPQLPQNIIDLGVRLQPNAEQIWYLSQQFPDKSLHFINSSFYAGATSTLEKFASVTLIDFYRKGNAWQNMLEATRQVAQQIGKSAQAEQLISDFSQKIAQMRSLVSPFTDRPILLVQFIDSRHLRIYAENSPFGEVLRRLGFQNGWQGSYNLWGFETVSVTELAKLPPNSRFVVVKPYPANVATALKHNTLWRNLTMAQDPLILPAVWTFGGMPSAVRFSEIFTDSLLNGGLTW